MENKKMCASVLASQNLSLFISSSKIKLIYKHDIKAEHTLQDLKLTPKLSM